MGIIPNVPPATLHDLQLHLTVRVGWGRVGIIYQTCPEHQVHVDMQDKSSSEVCSSCRNARED